MISDALSFSKRLFQARKELELRLGRTVPQTEIAAKLGVHSVTVGGWESGKSEPSLAMIGRLAAALGVRAGYLAFGEYPIADPANVIEEAEDAAIEAHNRYRAGIAGEEGVPERQLRGKGAIGKKRGRA